MWSSRALALRAFLTVGVAAAAPIACVVIPGGTKGSGDGAPLATQACSDYADAVGKAYVRCSLGTYQEGFKALVDQAALGDCKNIVKIRDHDALYNTCFATLQTINCLDLSNGNFDASCKEQLQRTQ